MVLWSSG